MRVESLIDEAVRLNYNGVAITDHECLTGHIRFLEHLDYLKKEMANPDKPDALRVPDDFKIILGNEIYLVDSLENVRDNYQSGVTRFWHFILLAKDKVGYNQLKTISSLSGWKNYFRQGKNERVPTVKSELETIIGNDRGHLIATTACLGGELPRWCVEYFQNRNADAKQKIKGFINWCIRVFGRDNFYVELQPSANSESEQSQRQAFVNQCLLKVAKAYGLKWIVTTDTHYLKKQHRLIHEFFLKSDGTNNESREVGDFYETTYMMEKDELFGMLTNHIPEEDAVAAFENTLNIHSKISEYSLFHDVVVPKDPHIPQFKLKHLFEEWYDKYRYIEKFAHSDNIQERYFLSLCEDGFIKLKQEFTDETVGRIDTEFKELWLISEKLGNRIANYYTLVRTIVHEVMWKVSYVGVARGSVTGYYTAYLSGITQMNPLLYNLPHWRHLEHTRPELPDIDCDTEKNKRNLIIQGMKDYFGSENVINTLTIRTVKSKSAALISCRGLGIDIDTAQTIADMIPFERGEAYSLKECFYGNEEKGRTPVTDFINLVNQYEHLKEMMFEIEGLACGRGIHASAVYIFDDGYLSMNARMKAPNGEDITAYNMTDSDKQGALKFDCLTIAALDKIHATVDELCEYGFITPCETLKETYDKYVHPDVLDYDTYEMWEMLDNHELIDAFQFDTTQGIQALKAIKPHAITELAVANTLMRLVAPDGEEQAADTYARNKSDISYWYKEVRDFGLTEDEIKILEPHLLPTYGVAETQEAVMKLSMDEKIAGFTIAEANGVRKSIAKKKPKLLAEMKEKFFQKGLSLGTSEKLLDYVWNVQFKKSFGYSFSLNHVAPYSCICLQEMNLAHHYPKIFWNVACLSVNSGASEEDEDSKTTQYGKIATALGAIQKQGQAFALPHINYAKNAFSPILETDEIMFSLKGIVGVGDSTIYAIIKHRPYSSLQDFCDKMNAAREEDTAVKISPRIVVSLIKAGCFDKLEGKNRVDIMKAFIGSIAPTKEVLKLQDVPTLYRNRIANTPATRFVVQLLNFRSHVCKKENFVKATGKSASTSYFRINGQKAIDFFYHTLETDLKEGKDYEYMENGVIILKQGSLNTAIRKLTQNYKDDILKDAEVLQQYNAMVIDGLFQELASGSIPQWEMQTLCYYYTAHELADVNKDKYGIVSYSTLSEEPAVVEWRKRGDKQIPRFQLDRICGTVLDKNKNKHLVSVLTDDGVVSVKFYKGQFIFYDKQLSEVGEDGTKHVMEKSWFSRGTKLLITGYRRNDQFVPRKYADSIYKHTVQLITDIDEDGTLHLQSERKGHEIDQ